MPQALSAALYLVENWTTPLLWAFCAEGLYPPRLRRGLSYWAVALSALPPTVFALWYPAGTDAFYLSGTLVWLSGMLLQTIVFCMVYEGPTAGKIAWYLAAFWTMNEAEVLPWSAYMALFSADMGAYGIFSALRSPWHYAVVLAAYFGMAMLIRYLLNLLKKLLPHQKKFVGVFCALVLTLTAVLMESDVIYMEVSAQDGAMHGMGGVYLLEGSSCAGLFLITVLGVRILQRLYYRGELQRAEAERLRQDAYFARELAESGKLPARRTENRAMLGAVLERLDAGDAAGAQQLLEAYGYEKRDADLPHDTANPVVNAVLYEIAARCAQAHIDFTVEGSVPARPTLEEKDLSGLVGNLLSNALEACGRQAEGEARRIRLRFAPGAGRLLIECENTCPAQSGGFFSTSKAEAGHGYGSHIIDLIASRYDGVVERRISGGRAFVSVLVACGEKEAV